MDEHTFWRIVEDLRVAADGDPEEMSQALAERFAEADDAALRGWEEQFLRASGQLYTWQHWAAAEMVCGFVSDDVFEDWRAWIVTLGRDTFQRVAADPDALADVDDLAGSCGGAGERFAYAVSTVYFERHGDEDEDFPIGNLEEPRGERLADPADVRAALPRLAARIPRDGLGQGPGSYVDP